MRIEFGRVCREADNGKPRAVLLDEKSDDLRFVRWQSVPEKNEAPVPIPFLHIAQDTYDFLLAHATLREPGERMDALRTRIERDHAGGSHPLPSTPGTNDRRFAP